LILEGIKLVYVFDGEAPELKNNTREKRLESKEEAREKYEKAKEKEDVLEMGKFARFDSHLDEKKIKESKELLEAMGIAVVQAPGEGEAQASYMAKQGLVHGVSSQDYDCLMFQSPKLIQNLSLARTRKTVSGIKEVAPLLMNLKEVLKELGINQEQLICLGILCGTDYNPGGVKGLGPKKSLKIIKEYKTKEKIFSAIAEKEEFERYEINFDWKVIYEEIKNPKTKKIKEIKFPKLNKDKIREVLLKYDFSEKRIDNQLEKLDVLKKKAAQQTLF
jgi:flap endonuclease-1